MLTWDLIVLVSLAYSAVLFCVAFWAEGRARRGRLGWLQSPLVYTLSLSVYCTGWTFYGAVGSAARNGLEFLTIYLGPTLMMLSWWVVLRKLVRIGKAERITSIADLISSRYGKSATLGAVVTLLAVVGTTPYIALQLQSLTLSFAALASPSDASSQVVTAFWIATGLGLFTILFGTRNVDANEQHPGVVTAIALEAVVKLVALLAVGSYLVWGFGGGLVPIFARAPTEELVAGPIFGPRWATLTFLAASAIICLPRMFQVMVVENKDERHLATASWAFPLYLLLICLFVLPIAILGKDLLPDENPDLYVLALPLLAGQDGLALLVFIGGFSASTSMVIVASIALSTMISNHIVVPLWLSMNAKRTVTSGDLRSLALGSRRAAIALVLGLGYFYFRLTGGTDALAAIGLIAFCGVAQVLPSILGGLFWQRASRGGAIGGILVGFAIWAYTLFLPSFGGSFLMPAAVIEHGLFGISALRPHALFGLVGDDPLVHTLFWSMSCNTMVLVAVSLWSSQSPLEQLQAARFATALRTSDGGPNLVGERYANSEDLFTLAQRILGSSAAHRLFAEAARQQGKTGGLPDPSEVLIATVERALAGAIGAASAHALVSQISGGGQVSVEELIRIANETAQIVEYSHRLEAQSTQLRETAEQLRRANTQLMQIGEQKDAFLSQVSHELRTPMTSIRSFADILRETPDLGSDDGKRFAAIIGSEAERMTRLLDEILDLSVLESGRAEWTLTPVRLGDAVARAVASTEGIRRPAGVTVTVAEGGMETVVMADIDRLAQVVINLISNAVKYGAPDKPEIHISAAPAATGVALDVRDNGPGIAEEDAVRIFEKFSRLSHATLAGSAGLGLPISREIMRNLGGALHFVPDPRGAVFRMLLPRAVDAPSTPHVAQA